MKYDIVTIGDAMKDIFVFPALDEIEKPICGSKIDKKLAGEKFLALGYGDKITISDSYYDIGGTACNVAVGLSKLGRKSAIIANCGGDDVGEEIIEKLKAAKVDTSKVNIHHSRKSSFSVIISYKGERSILVYHGFEPKDYEIPKNLQTDWLYVGPIGDGYKGLYSKIVSLASEKNVKIALNPGSVQIHDGIPAFGGLLSVTNILFLNKEEARQLAGVSNLVTVKEIAKALKRTGVEMIVITDGQDGAYVYYEGEFMKIGIYPGHRVESTGAGDAFASGFLAAKIQDKELLTCLKWGVTNSASVVGKYGAQQGLLSKSSIEKMVSQYRWPAETLRFA